MQSVVSGDLCAFIGVIFAMLECYRATIGFQMGCCCWHCGGSYDMFDEVVGVEAFL